VNYPLLNVFLIMLWFFRRRDLQKRKVQLLG
jgi:hypothetical protein